jgi:hypothetical protein
VVAGPITRLVSNWTISARGNSAAQLTFALSIRRRTDGKRRKGLSVCVRVWRRCGVIVGLIPRVCETFVERAGSRGLALLIAGKTAVAPARIIVALKAERVSGRDLCMCARRALDRGNNKQRRHPFRLHASFPGTAMCHGGGITFAVHRDRTLGRRSRTAYAKSGNNFGKTIVWIFISPEIAHRRFLHSRCESRSAYLPFVRSVHAIPYSKEWTEHEESISCS